MMDSSVVSKLLGIFEATAGRADGVPLVEISAEVGLAKPTAHRILKQLVATGFMERCGPGVYRQTPQAWRLVSLDGDRRLTRAADKPLQNLWQATGETANVGVLRQGKVVYLTVLESPQPLRRSVSPTMTDPFACTALGRAIAAHLPAERLDYLLEHTAMEKRTPNTNVDPAAIRELLQAARDQGYAVEEDETDLGVMCLGAAIFDDGRVVAGVSLSAPTARASRGQRKAWAEEVRAAADDITARLGESHGD